MDAPRQFFTGFVATMLLLIVIGLVAATFYTGTGQIISTVAAGTAPFIIKSTTMVANLNAEFLQGLHAHEVTKRTCRPLSPEFNTTSTTWVVAYNCTACSGHLAGISFRGAQYAYINISVDDETPVTFSTSTVGLHKSQWGRIRFAKSLTIRLRSSNSAYTAYVRPYLCLDEVQASGAKPCVPKEVSGWANYANTSWQLVYNCTGCSGYLTSLWMVADDYYDYPSIRGWTRVTVDGTSTEEFTSYSPLYDVAKGPAHYFLDSRFNTNLTVEVRAHYRWSSTATTEVRFCLEE